MRWLLLFVPLLAPAADLAPIPRPTPNPIVWQPGFESSAQPAAYLREASLAVESNLFRYSSWGAEFRFRNANPSPTFHYGPALPIPLTIYPKGRRIERYRSVRLANLYPNIDSTFSLSPEGQLSWTLACTQSPCDWSAVVVDVPLSPNITLNADSLFIPLGESRLNPRIAFAPPSGGKYRVLSLNAFGFETPEANVITVPFAPPLFSTFTSTLEAIQPDGGRILAFSLPDLQLPSPPYPNERLRGCFSSLGSPGRCLDAALARFSPQGQLLWATVLSGARAEQLTTLAVAPNSPIYLSGRTNSNDFPTTSSSLQPRYAGPESDVLPNLSPQSLGDLFVSRIDPQNGNLIASTYVGGPADEPEANLEIASDGSVFLLPKLFGGRPESAPTTPGVLIPNCPAPCANSWAARLSTDLSRFLYATFLPTGSTAVYLHTDQSLYFSGTSTSLPTTANAAIPTTTSRASAYVARLDPAGSRLLAATYLDSEWSSSYALTVAPTGDAWVSVSRVNERPQRTLLVSSDATRLIATTPVKTSNLTTDAVGNLHAVDEGIEGVYLCGLRYVVYDRNGRKRIDLPIPGHAAYRFAKEPIPTLLLNGIPHRLDEAAPEPVLITCVSSPSTFIALDAVAPGMILTLFGQHMGPTATRVFLNGWEAPVLYASANQLNIQVPWELEPGAPVDFEVQSAGRSSRFLRLNRVDRAAGQIFRVFLNQDGTLNSPSNPAALGSVVSLWATGLGNTNPPAATGEIFPLEPRPLASRLTMSSYPRINLEVLYAGAAPGFISGLNQVNVRLPSSYIPPPGAEPNVMDLNLETNGPNIFTSVAFKLYYRP